MHTDIFQTTFKTFQVSSHCHSIHVTISFTFGAQNVHITPPQKL